jgi:hypothetical protein
MTRSFGSWQFRRSHQEARGKTDVGSAVFHEFVTVAHRVSQWDREGAP